VILVVIVALKLVLLHGPGGQIIEINPDQVVTLREPRMFEGHIPPGTNCVVNMADGKFNLVQEACATVRDMMEEIWK
jgi:hypothetical protein